MNVKKYDENENLLIQPICPSICGFSDVYEKLLELPDIYLSL